MASYRQGTLCYSHFLHHIFHFLGTTWHVYMHIIYKRSTFLLLSRMMYMDGQWKEYKQHSEGQRLLRSKDEWSSCHVVVQREGNVLSDSSFGATEADGCTACHQLWLFFKSYPVTPCLPFDCAQRAVITFFLCSISRALWKYLPLLKDCLISYLFYIFK